MAQVQSKLAQLKQFDVEQFKNEAIRPLFAVAGATELAVDLARGYADQAQERLDVVQSRVAGLSRIDYRDTRALQSQARELINDRLDELTREARDAQARFEARIAELQQDARRFPGRFQAQVAEAVGDLSATYADLAARGEKFVAAIRKDGVKAVTAVKKAPSKSTVARREAQPATGTTRTPASKPTAKKSGTAKSSTAKSAAKKSTAKKSTAKNSTAKNSTAAKKSS